MPPDHCRLTFPLQRPRWQTEHMQQPFSFRKDGSDSAFCKKTNSRHILIYIWINPESGTLILKVGIWLSVCNKKIQTWWWKIFLAQKKLKSFSALRLGHTSGISVWPVSILGIQAGSKEVCTYLATLLLSKDMSLPRAGLLAVGRLVLSNVHGLIPHWFYRRIHSFKAKVTIA